MNPSYSVEFTVEFQNHAQTDRCQIDDPKACEEFLAELLERGIKIRHIRRDREVLPQREADRMIKASAWLLARKYIGGSLGISGEEARSRF